MAENIKNNFEQKEENENKPKKHNKGRPRKYSSDEERIRISSKKQCEEKRRLTQFMKQLKEEGRWAQLELIKKLKKNKYDPKYIDKLYKELDKHEDVNSRARDKGGNAEQKQ